MEASDGGGGGASGTICVMNWSGAPPSRIAIAVYMPGGVFDDRIPEANESTLPHSDAAATGVKLKWAASIIGMVR